MYVFIDIAIRIGGIPIYIYICIYIYMYIYIYIYIYLYIYKDTEEVEERVAIFANSLIAQRLHELEQVPLRHTHHS